jgi:hypothetical protein
MPIVIRGVHPIEADEPCHLIEIELIDVTGGLNFADFTQDIAGRPRENWQVAYDEEPLDDGECIWTFFFHYLDFAKPLLTPEGPMKLPPATPLPGHLRRREYWPP